MYGIQQAAYAEVDPAKKDAVGYTGIQVHRMNGGHC